jgi:hypothetical protein
MINIVYSCNIHYNVHLWKYNLKPISFFNHFNVLDLKIEIIFSFIYTMHYNGLMIFHIFSMFNMCTWVEPFTFNMLKLLFTSCILDLLKYIETYVNWCFAIILEWFSEFFHISWTTNIYIWVQSSTLNQLKSLLKCWILHLLVYIETHNNLILHVYTWTC